MTTIKSGYWTTPSNTPTGLPFRAAVDNPYVTKDEFIQSFEGRSLGITPNDPSYTNGELDRKILQASSWVNRYCRRWFDTQRIDETKTGIIVRPFNPQLVTHVFANRPYQKVHSIYIQVLKWFIEIDTSPSSGYLQDFPDKGFMKIVPLLSNSGTGTGSPMPADIVDRTALGVLWVNYTFGFGTNLVGETLINTDGTKQYQAVLNNRLWAPDQTTTVYDSGVLVDPANYTVSHPNGMVTFNTGYTVNGAVTADFTTNESVPYDIKVATILYTMFLIGQAQANPMGTQGWNAQTISMSWGDKNKLEERIKAMLDPYAGRMPKII